MEHDTSDDLAALGDATTDAVAFEPPATSGKTLSLINVLATTAPGSVWACQTPNEMRVWLSASSKTAKLADLADKPEFTPDWLLNNSADEIERWIKQNVTAPQGQRKNLTSVRLFAEGHCFYRIVAWQMKNDPSSPLCDGFGYDSLLGYGAFGVAWKVGTTVLDSSPPMVVSYDCGLDRRPNLAAHSFSSVWRVLHPRTDTKTAR